MELTLSAMLRKCATKLHESCVGGQPGLLRIDHNRMVAQANPWMRPEVEMIVAQDESVTGMFNWCAKLLQSLSLCWLFDN